jgi:hypothetical protein
VVRVLIVFVVEAGLALLGEGVLEAWSTANPPEALITGTPDRVIKPGRLEGLLW